MSAQSLAGTEPKASITGRLVAIPAGLVIPVALVAIWFLTTRDATAQVPTPGGVVASAVELTTDGELFGSLGTSLVRVLAGFGLGLALGTVIGVFMGRFRLVFEVVDPLIETVRPIAPIALVPLAILWLGTGSIGAIAIIAYSTFFPIALNVYAAVRRLDGTLSNAARTFGANEPTILVHVVLPGILPALVVGARVAMGLAWASVIAAELAIGSGSSQTAGIGQTMLTFYQYEVDPHPIIVCMIAVGLTGLILDQIIRWLGHRVTPWTR